MKFIQLTVTQTTYGKTIFGLTDTGRIFEQADVPSANRTGPEWKEVLVPKNMEPRDTKEEQSRVQTDAVRYSLVWLNAQIESEATIIFNKDSVLHIRVKKALGLEE